MLTDSYGRDIDADLVYSRDYNVYEHTGGSASCKQNNEVGYAGEYTVTGKRCQFGGCKLNPDVHYWYCETDDSGGWDYCCRPGGPDQRCGYSQNYK